MHRFFGGFLLVGSLLPGQQSSPAENLFDGTSLRGWRGDPAVWSVRDGCLVGSTVGHEIAANTFLVLDGKQPGDFEFSASFRMEGDNNSGVQYRSRELDGGGFRLAGYQCDVHPTPNYLAMLYDEQGAGIVARQGQCVRWLDAGPQQLGDLARPRAVDLTQWHRVRIVASGDLLWHELDGNVVTAVKDERGSAPRRGLFGLQVHAGAPMTIWWKDLVMVEKTTPAAQVPLAVRALLRSDELRSQRPHGLVPQWLWDEAPGPDEELFFRRAFALASVPKAARLAVSCDNHCRLYVNGQLVGKGDDGRDDDWERPVVVDVAKQLVAGDNVVAVHGWNAGGPAGLVVRLSWQLDGKEHELVSDGSWTCSDDDPDGWNTAAFDAKAWKPVRVLAAMGEPEAPWSRALDAEALGSSEDVMAPQVAVPEVNVDGIECERLLDVSRALGSWVSLGHDDQGRLYSSAQGGGLYRITPAKTLGELTTIERVPVELGGAHGLLWFHDALYAVVNGKDSGLYRLTDSDGDGMPDHVELLQALEGEGEHGPHSVVVAPDHVHLLVICGNQTKLPPLAGSRVATNWAEDRLLPRLDDPNPYWEGISPPGGWVCQIDADGKNWELICCGFRNPFDLAVLPGGEVVTYDADMEWDMGTPWYRPTRLLAVQSGVDYGWRIGNAKWPADYPEAPPALRDMGPGSPTGLASGVAGGVPFVLALDWTFGTVHYVAPGQPGQPLAGRALLTGAPLPLTDVAVVGKSTYLMTGGRGLPSRLLRLPIGNDTDDASSIAASRASQWGGNAPWAATETRSPVAILDAGVEPTGSSPTPWVEARIALERLPVAQWRAEALAVDAAKPMRSLIGLLALARQGEAADLQPMLDALGKLPFAPLPHAQRIAWLRAHALALLRLGPADAAQRQSLATRLLPLLPANDEREDADLTELLAYVDAPGLLDKAVPMLTPMRPSPTPPWAETTKRNATYGGVIDTMAKAMPPIGQIAIANALRIVNRGWTLEQRRDYFTFLAAARKQKGGSSYDGYLKKIIDAAWATCSPAEQQQLAEVVGLARAEPPKFVATPPKGPGHHWQVADIDGVVRDGFDGVDIAAGHNLFHAVGCASCHYFAGEGGNHGPDLTSLGNKFAARDVLESIFEPSKVVSEQYAGQVLTKKDGTALFGFVTKAMHGDNEVYDVMPAVIGAELVTVPATDVQKLERSPLSPMPTDLVDGLSRDELRQLLAFLLSRGQAH